VWSPNSGRDLIQFQLLELKQLSSWFNVRVFYTYQTQSIHSGLVNLGLLGFKLGLSLPGLMVSEFCVVRISVSVYFSLFSPTCHPDALALCLSQQAASN